MKKSVLLWSLLVLLPLTTTSHAGQVIYRETETSIYVELTGEWDKISDGQKSGKAQVQEPQAEAQPSSSVSVEVATASPPAAGKAAEQTTDRNSKLIQRAENRRKARVSRGPQDDEQD